ncbi:MAG: Xaa-Pro aminopeptidase [Chloroflexota bacterium]|nr:Xaa-Pro aminopeptidase [Chloroflexota bacterium]
MKKDLDRFMQEENVDALWVMGAMYNNPDMVYFTGIHHANQVDLFKLRGKEPLVFHFVDMEREEARRCGLETHAYDEDYPLTDYLKRTHMDMLEAIALRLRDVLTSIGLSHGRVAVSGWDNLGPAWALLKRVGELLPELELTSFMNQSPILLARLTKSPQEVEHIRAMGKLTTSVVARVADLLTSSPVKDEVLQEQNGDPLTIGRVKQLIDLWLAELGADNPEETIFSIGRDGGVPHSTSNPTDVLKLGTPIVFDIFPREKGGGYFYDFTRTWCLGYAPEPVQALYEQVLQVHHRVIDELQPNTPFKQYQQLTCQLFEEMGHETVAHKPQLSEGYVHSVGHGLGLDVHENPFSGTAASKRDMLLPGSVFSIEPGLYYPSLNVGVRIEDTVYLNPQGKFEILADYPYDLVLPVKK